MPSFHSAGTLPVDHTLVMTLCKASLIGFSAPFRSSAVKDEQLKKETKNIMKKPKTVHMHCFVYRLTGPEATGLCGD